ncbi:expressed unknown protein [Ectocarpus siliculosus]|uniref:Uncharacterized protein n=1 Tax=Ectocarpus siliculosus TaxID=2880 RepID=D7FSD2_ECTSI|nr:expressed unknown protein [Ectocarpus siliculosus]|eukprot:CBJ31073.1 expressed unknown protein [Ectocarpus siliculosus]
MLGDRSYSLLLSDKEVSWKRNKSHPGIPSTPTQGSPLGGASPISVTAFSSAEAIGVGAGGGQKSACGTLWGAEGETEKQGWRPGEEEEDVEEDEDGEAKGMGDKARIVAFIRRMTFNGLLAEDDRTALENSAVAGDAVINAAFAVALRSQDVDYLSALFKDIASNRRGSPQGMRLLEAKREMLDMVEVLQQADEVDDEQLVYLQNLILVSNEAVSDAFGVYEEDQDPVRLAESLKQLCGAQDGAVKPAAVAAVSAADDNDDNDVLKTEADHDAMQATILKVATNLTNESLLGPREASVLNTMISRENPVLVAAFKLFRENGKAAELYDTVARAARFETGRVAGQSGSRGEQESGNAGQVAGSSQRLQVTRKASAAAATAAESAAAAGLDDTRGKGGRACRVGAPTRDSGATTADEDGVGEGADRAAALMEFQRLVTLAVQKDMMDMCDARVSREEALCLATPSPGCTQAILKSLEEFEGSSNRDRLLNAFAGIAKAEMLKRNGKDREGEDEEEEEEEEEDDEEEEENNSEQDGEERLDGERQEENENEVSDDRAMVELMELADCMAGDKSIGAQEAALLAKLIENKYPPVIQAYEDYAASQDVGALVSALMAIVGTQGGEQEVGGMEEPRAQEEKQRRRERVVLLMHDTKVLTASDATRLLLLLAQEDPNSLAAFEAFDSSKDVSSLVEAIKTILQDAPPIAPAMLTMEAHPDGGRSNSSQLLTQILQPLPDANDDAATSEDSDGSARLDSGNNAANIEMGEDGGSDADAVVAENVVSIVDGMGLDESEAAALRLAIANGDVNMKGALELFRLDSDAQELEDTFARVARLVLEREHESRLTGQVPDASRAMGENSCDSNNDVATANSGEETRNIDFTLDGKAGLFQELLQQLERVGVMSEAQAVVIMDRYRSKDAVVFAALDVYKNENDMSELVDTLKRLT